MRNMSWSQSETISQCPRKWWHTYYKRDVPFEVSPALAFGTLVHSAAEQFLLSGMTSQTRNLRHRMALAANYAWDNRPVNEIEWTDEHRRKLFLALYSLEEIFNLKKLKIANRMSLERKLRMDSSVPGWGLTGVIDMVAMYKDKLILCDFKTGKHKLRNTAPVGQVAFYAYMWNSVPDHRPLEGVAIAYLGVPWMAHMYTDYDFFMAQAKRKVELSIQKADEYSTDEPPPTSPSALCGWCASLGKCEDGQAVVRKRLREGKSASEQAVDIMKGINNDGL